MKRKTEIKWDQLSPTAKGALFFLAKALDGKFTGRFELGCEHGGVKWISEHTNMPGKDLPSDVVVDGVSLTERLPSQ